MNRQITLAARPVGYPKESDFKLVETPIPTPEDGQALIKTIYLSVDPYMRGRMNQARSYAANVEFNEVIVGGVIAQVVESKHSDFNRSVMLSTHISVGRNTVFLAAKNYEKLILQLPQFQQVSEFSVCRG